MAVPKRKKSRSRTRHRKAHWLKGSTPTVVKCAACGADTLPHTVCPTCGAYRDRQVVDTTT